MNRRYARWSADWAAAVLLFAAAPRACASQTELSGSVGSGAFGAAVTVLSNGNFVVTDPAYSISGDAANVGAVYLYDGATLAVISTLTGSTANDRVGNGGVTVLPNGNYVVYSGAWNNGAVAAAGAVTWCSGTSGVYGAVSAANSLVGSTTNDNVGMYGMTVLANGNYVVHSYNWNNGSTTTVGAATWCSGASGTKGVVSPTNSLVGVSTNDMVGAGGITPLANGNYVVRSQYWQNGAVFQVGAVTWGNGAVGTKGRVSATNSLIGSTSSDKVGSGGVTALANGNYVVGSPNWDRGTSGDVGAATWGSGTSGVTGVVSAANSLVGSNGSDQVGSAGALALANGNYVVRSPNWDRGSVSDVGAATWCNGTTGTKGVVAATNSLVGSAADDRVGLGALALASGGYVVLSLYWDNGAAADAGAATWCGGASMVTGVVSAANSLVGGTAGDQVGSGGAAALANGGCVVLSPNWDNGLATDAGAATWGGVTGLVSAANSLVGSSAGDQVSSGGVTLLPNGNYVVSSPKWINGGAANAGAVTSGNGSGGVSGAVSATNSLVGGTAGDKVGSGGATALTNGNYVVCSPNWSSGAAAGVGAVTWVRGGGGTTGAVSAANSLVGGTAGDGVGGYGITAFTNSTYLLRSPSWDNGAAANAGAVSLGGGVSDMTGLVSPANSVLGDVAGGGSSMTFALDASRKRLLVGYPSGNRSLLQVFKGLAIRSDHGTSNPAPGARLYAEGAVLTNTAASPDTQGTTQYVCSGWSMAGNEPASGADLSCVMTLTNDAALTWQWRTNYWLASAAGTNGSVTVGSGWQAKGVTTQVLAVADLYYHFTNWTGDASSTVNPLSLLIDSPKAVTANFAADMTTNQPTPLWWLAQYGVVSNVEEAVLADIDGDGHAAWQEYVAGTVPTNPHSVLRALIAVSNDAPRITWAPDLGAARVYTVDGRSNLTADAWGATNAADRFFRVKVSMP